MASVSTRAAIVLLVLAATMTSQQSLPAGTILVSGDSSIGRPITGYYNARRNPNNDEWFTNILGDGESVALQRGGDHQSVAFSAAAILFHYDQLEGVKWTNFVGTITPEALDGVDLFISMMPSEPYLPSELVALSDFVHSGGSLFFLGENNSPTLVEFNERINDALQFLGSSMRLGDSNNGLSYQTTGALEPHPYNLGIDSLTYAATNDVTGGIPLVRTRVEDGGGVFIAFEVIPEPASVALLTLVAAGTTLCRRRAKYVLYSSGCC